MWTRSWKEQLVFNKASHTRLPRLGFSPRSSPTDLRTSSPTSSGLQRRPCFILQLAELTLAAFFFARCSSPIIFLPLLLKTSVMVVCSSISFMFQVSVCHFRYGSGSLSAIDQWRLDSKTTRVICFSRHHVCWTWSADPLR